MPSSAKKLLKEPLLWLGAIALCVPLFASGQLSNLGIFLRSGQSQGTVAKNLKANVDTVSVPKTKTKTEIVTPRDSVPAAIPALITETLPKVATPTAEVTIFRLPQPELTGNRDPGSLLDAADLFGYEMTADPAIDEPASEPAAEEDLELSIGGETADNISLDPSGNSPPSVRQQVAVEQQDSLFGSQSETDNGQAASETKSVELPEVTSYPMTATTASEPHVPQFSSSRLSYSQPSTPMRFQAALPPRKSFGYSPSQPYVDGSYQQMMPQTVRPQDTIPTSQSQLDAISIWDN